jgi:hypothetical protein
MPAPKLRCMPLNRRDLHLSRTLRQYHRCSASAPPTHSVGDQRRLQTSAVVPAAPPRARKRWNPRVQRERNLTSLTINGSSFVYVNHLLTIYYLFLQLKAGMGGRRGFRGEHRHGTGHEQGGGAAKDCSSAGQPKPSGGDRSGQQGCREQEQHHPRAMDRTAQSRAVRSSVP